MGVEANNSRRANACLLALYQAPEERLAQIQCSLLHQVLELKQSRQGVFEDVFGKSPTLLFHCARVKNLKGNESKELAEGLYQ